MEAKKYFFLLIFCLEIGASVFGQVSPDEIDLFYNEIISNVSEYQLSNSEKSEIFSEVFDFLKVSEKENNKLNICLAHLSLSELYLRTFRTTKNASYHVAKALNYSKSLHSSQISFLIDYQLANISFENRKIKNAKAYTLKCLAYLNEGHLSKERAKSYYGWCYNQLGTINYSKGNVTTAIDYLKRAVNFMSPLEKVNTYYNLAGILLASNEYERAKKYIKLTFDNTENTQELDLNIILRNSIADYWLRNNNLDSAEYYLQEAFRLSNELKIYSDMSYGYQLSSRLNEKRGDLNKALEMSWKSKKMNDSLLQLEIADNFNILEVMHEKSIVEKDLIRKEKDLIISEKSSDLRRIWLVLVVILLVLVSFSAVFVVMRNRKDRSISKAKLELSTLKLKTKEKELTAYALDIVQKAKFSQQLYFQLQKIKKLNDKDALLSNITQLLHELKNRININQNLMELKQVMLKIDEKFYSKIEEYSPDLSERDKELCGLIMLKLSNSEIATILGIAPFSVKTKKHRLKKKLKLDKETVLFDFLQKL